jgi:hypothetical protein
MSEQDEGSGMARRVLIGALVGAVVGIVVAVGLLALLGNGKHPAWIGAIIGGFWVGLCLGGFYGVATGRRQAS